MSNTETPEVTENERHEWVSAASSFDKELLIGYIIGWDPKVFDRARFYVERVRAGVVS